ncbi:uridine phosphorylase [Algoriphagus ratkowskyi]|uniref:Uridine phosphorylase n=1 Tax=Algoriphagus ratkowskyi TaxID=57028 RepID=A0A2W7RLF7_9BACT|nr:nucleoside phosphorylase [Algoriphagus ratkowskyi]PZX59806.1 uridine phosphorylase [Algoriphagus ratkowskyi]TXD78485.1 phosphorylase [Algoriphagus ratkowskyi]
MSRQIPESELILNADGSIYHLYLKPENLASLVFTVGDPDRVPMVSSYFDQVDFKVSKREFVTHTGRLNGKRVTVMSTGMGTDNVEILMTELDSLVNVDLKTHTVKPIEKSLEIIRLGTSGSMQADLPVGSLLASEIAVGIDTLMQFYPELKGNQAWSNLVKNTLDLTFLPYQASASVDLLQRLPSEFHRGVTLTAPGFYAPQGREIRLKPKLDNMIERLAELEIQGLKMTNFEMETAGYYAMGQLLNHRMLSLNAIVANRPTGEFDKEAEKTVDRMIRAALEVYC